MDDYLDELAIYYGRSLDHLLLSEAQRVSWSSIRKSMQNVIKLKKNEMESGRLEMQNQNKNAESINQALVNACAYRAQLEVELEEYEAKKGQAEFSKRHGIPFDETYLKERRDPYEELINYSVEHLVEAASTYEQRIKDESNRIEKLQSEIEACISIPMMIFSEFESPPGRLRILMQSLRYRHHFDAWKRFMGRAPTSILQEEEEEEDEFILPEYPYKCHWSEYKYKYENDYWRKCASCDNDLNVRMNTIIYGERNGGATEERSDEKKQEELFLTRVRASIMG